MEQEMSDFEVHRAALEEATLSVDAHTSSQARAALMLLDYDKLLRQREREATDLRYQLRVAKSRLKWQGIYDGLVFVAALLYFGLR